MMLLALAWRNLAGAGLRTALNVTVLSLAFVAIVGTLGLLEGFNRQTSRAMIETEYGGGQAWHPRFDPLDPLTFQEAHGPLPGSFTALAREGRAVPILQVPATIYPQGRLRPVVLKGIDPSQRLLAIPTGVLNRRPAGPDDPIPVLIGMRMARATGLQAGDFVTVQWKDSGGTNDARDAQIVEVMKTTVQTVDVNQLWVPIETLRELAAMPGEATLIVFAPGVAAPPPGGWVVKSLDELLADIRMLIRSKAIASAVVYLMLLFLAMLAIFDTQVLSIFKRRKEIGTLVALGMTRGRVIRLFTIEGALHGVLAVGAALVYGGPLLWWFSRRGWTLTSVADDYGFAIGDTLYPYYSPRLVVAIVLFLLAVTTVVSYLPTRRIASLEPTEALRGRAGCSSSCSRALSATGRAACCRC